jgi:hypothetical protein
VDAPNIKDFHATPMEVTMTTPSNPVNKPHNYHSFLFSQITVTHGPAGLLSRFLLRAEHDARERGISLSLGTMQELVELNRANRPSWHPVFSGFDPDMNDLSEDNAVGLFGYTERGEVVAAQAARIYHWPLTNYAEEARTLRLLYSDPEKYKLPDERCEVSAVAARGLTGRIVYSGAAWYRPDYRGRGLVEILPRIARAYAYTRWNSECTVTMMAEALVRKGVHWRTGHQNIEWDVRFINSRDDTNSRHGTIRFALLWTKTDEMLEDLVHYLNRPGAPGDAALDVANT